MVNRIANTLNLDPHTITWKMAKPVQESEAGNRSMETPYLWPVVEQVLE